MAYRIIWQPRGVIWTFYDALTSEDAIQANLDIYGDPRFDDLRYQIVDISGVKEFKATSDAMEETAAMDEAASLHNPHQIVAVVVNEGDASEMAEMYKSAMKDSPWKVAIFSSMEDAEQWIHSFAG